LIGFIKPVLVLSKEEEAMKIACVVVCGMFLLGILAVSDAEAPLTQIKAELGYQIDDAGRIFDENGNLKGWLKDNLIYDGALSVRYTIDNKGAVREADDETS
jgi:hypothetical protein